MHTLGPDSHILFILDYYAPRYGGAEKLFSQLVDSLLDKDCHVTIITSRHDPTLPSYTTIKKLTIYRTGRSRYTLWRYGLRSGIKFFVSQHQRSNPVTLIHTTSYCGALPARALAQIFSIPLTITIHELFGDLRKTIHPRTYRLYTFYENLLTRLDYNAIVAVSDATIKQINAYNPTIQTPIHRIYNGVDPIFYTLGAEGEGKGDKTMLEMGSEIGSEVGSGMQSEAQADKKMQEMGSKGGSMMGSEMQSGMQLKEQADKKMPEMGSKMGSKMQSEEQSSEDNADTQTTIALYYGHCGFSKGVDTYIEALPTIATHYPDTTFWFNLLESKNTQKTIKTLLKLQQTYPIVITQTVSAQKLQSLIARASLIVLPSRSEGFGLAVAEASASGTPLITTGAGAIPEVAYGRVYLLEATDPEAYRKARDAFHTGAFHTIPKKVFPRKNTIQAYHTLRERSIQNGST